MVIMGESRKLMNCDKWYLLLPMGESWRVQNGKLWKKTILVKDVQPKRNQDVAPVTGSRCNPVTPFGQIWHCEWNVDNLHALNFIL